MSRNLVLYIAMSLDGYIAKKDRSVDFLTYENDNADNSAYENFYNTIDTIIMGKTTYNQIKYELSKDIWPYKEKDCYIVTTKNLEPYENIKFISNKEIMHFTTELKKENKKDIWIVGGSKLANIFIKENLIDKYIISIVPTILGDGIPLFLNTNKEIKLKLIDSKNINNIIELTYIKTP